MLKTTIAGTPGNEVFASFNSIGLVGQQGTGNQDAFLFLTYSNATCSGAPDQGWGTDTAGCAPVSANFTENFAQSLSISINPGQLCANLYPNPGNASGFPDYSETNCSPLNNATGETVCFGETVCYGAGTEILTANGTGVPIEKLAAGTSVVDSTGGIHSVRRVVRNQAVDSLVTFRPNAIASGVPSQKLTVTASHLVALPNGTVVSAGHLADVHRRMNGDRQISMYKPGGLTAKLSGTKSSVVYHIILDDWVFLPVHGLACESAAVTPAHFVKRDGACPFCTHDHDIGHAAEEAQFVGSL
jgi:hypothetical protein